jgi:hypothetical protein
VDFWARRACRGQFLGAAGAWSGAGFVRASAFEGRVECVSWGATDPVVCKNTIVANSLVITGPTPARRPQIGADPGAASPQKGLPPTRSRLCGTSFSGLACSSALNALSERFAGPRQPKVRLLRRVPVVEIQETTQSLSAHHTPTGRVRLLFRNDQLTGKPRVVSLVMIMRGELLNGGAHKMLTQRHELAETFRFHRENKPFRVGINIALNGPV